MSGGSKKIVLTPIGVVKRRSSEGGVKDKSAVCEITVKSGLTSALEGIEEYSHLYVLFWMHKLNEEDRSRRKVCKGIQESADYRKWCSSKQIDYAVSFLV